MEPISISLSPYFRTNPNKRGKEKANYSLVSIIQKRVNARSQTPIR